MGLMEDRLSAGKDDRAIHIAQLRGAFDTFLSLNVNRILRCAASAITSRCDVSGGRQLEPAAGS